MSTHNDVGSIIEDVVLYPKEGVFGVNVPRGVWYKVESLASGSCFFECKEGPFVPHEEDGILAL